MSRNRFALVVEQTLGHAAHSRNLERFLAERTDLEGTLIPLEFEGGGLLKSLPGLSNWSLRASLAARSGLRRRLAQGPLDGLFIHTQVASLLSAGMMRRVPGVVSLDATPANFDSQGDAYGHRRRDGVEGPKRWINRRSLLAARRLVAWCAWARDSLVADYGVPPERISVVPPGVDQALFRPREQRRPGPPRVLFVGGDFDRKGGPDLLAAIERIEGPLEADLVTGTGLTGSPQRRVRPHHGLAPQSSPLVELYRQADVFVLPSRGDCLPQAVAEAMACGLPVVCTRVGALPEMVEDGHNGHLVPTGSPTALAAAIGRLLADAALRERMGAASLARARRRHDARRNCNAVFDLMLAVAAAPRERA